MAKKRKRKKGGIRLPQRTHRSPRTPKIKRNQRRRIRRIMSGRRAGGDSEEAHATVDDSFSMIQS